MAQHDIDPAADSHAAGESSANDAWTTTKVDHPAETERTESEAISAPASEAAPAQKPRRKNWHRFTLLAATLGLLATAGSIAAYRFRDKNEKLAAFATIVDETFARPEKLIATLRETIVKATGKPAAPEKPADKPGAAKLAEPLQKSTPAPAETKPAEPAAPPRSGGDHITWNAPATPATPPAPVPAPAAPAPVVVAPPPAPAKPAAEANPVSSAQIETLTRRVDELERIARSALALAEQARSAEPAAAPRGAKVPDQKVQDVEDNVSGLEGRIDWLSDEVKTLRDKLDAAKDETRAPREVDPAPPPPAPVAAAPEEKGPNPATVAVVAHSLQRALDRGAPFPSEYAILSAQGADSQALAALAPLAEKGAPDARALRASFHPLVRKLEASADLKPDAPLADRLLQGASKLVKVRSPVEKEKATIGDIADKLEAALDRGEIETALAAFAEFPDAAKAVAREWETQARQRVEAEKAAASILAGALDALAKPKN
ncbi:COG4223 family protein [Methylosinus sporium]|uniref:COG4223 family protein n=1 Tax=Methylosinus sporium TaxID=428 RepID=UPI00383A0C54